MESRLGGGNGIGSRSGGGNGIDKEVEIDKEVDRTGGGLGDEYNDQDEGKGRRIEEGSRNGGGSDSSVEFGGMLGFAGKSIEHIDRSCSSHFGVMKLVIDERRHYLQSLCDQVFNCEFMPKVPPLVSDRHEKIEICRFGESRCFAGSRCFGCCRIGGISNKHQRQQQRNDDDNNGNVDGSRADPRECVRRPCSLDFVEV